MVEIRFSSAISQSLPISSGIITICLSFCLHLSLIFSTVEGFNSLIQLPRSRSSNDPPPQCKTLLNVNDFGAKGDGLTDDTKALIDVWKTACSLPSRSEIRIPFGNTYLLRPTEFAGPCRSKVTLRISGTIVAPKDPQFWDGLNPRKWLYFSNVNHFTVEGGGTVNGTGHEWWARSCKTNATNPCRHAPTAMTFHRCKFLKVRKLVMVDSQQMHMAFTNCVQVAASDLSVSAPSDSPNTDGIHLSSSTRVELKNSVIRTGDDCVSIVGNSSRIRIKNIACGPGHGISIGSLGKSKSLAQVHDIRVDGAFISNTENGVRIKTWQGGSGFVSKITFQNIVMENVSNPIIIDQYYCDSRQPCLNQTQAVRVEDISFVAIKGSSATEEAIKFACSDSSPCKNLRLENIQLESSSGEPTRSFCWQAEGSSSGLVHPPPCFSCFGNLIKQNVSSTSLLQSI